MCKKVSLSSALYLFLKDLYHDFATIIEAKLLSHYRGSAIYIDDNMMVSGTVHDILFSPLGKRKEAQKTGPLCDFGDVAFQLAAKSDQ